MANPEIRSNEVERGNFGIRTNETIFGIRSNEVTLVTRGFWK